MKLMHKAERHLSKAIVLALITGVFFTYSGCETDFDVNAPWKDITVVVGLLDQSEDIHYIKINKAYLGEGDANEMAQIRDSIEYKNLTAIIERWRYGSRLDVKAGVPYYTLRDTVVNTLEPGIFHSPDQKVYYFNEPNLDVDSKYKLIITIGDDVNKDTVRAETEIINDDELLITYPPVSIPLSFATATDYVDRDFKWRSVADGKRYQLTLRFHYNDIIDNGSDTISVPHYVDWVFSVQKSFDLSGGDELRVTIKGEEFYQLIDRQVPDFTGDGNLIKRWPDDSLEYFISVAGEELNTYIEVNSPSTGIVQEKPEYTNVENGLGIFSCRFRASGLRQMYSATIRELVNGSIGGHTTNKGFCNPLLGKENPASCYYGQ